MTATCHIVPPYLLRALLASPDPEVAGSAARTLENDAGFRADRGARYPRRRAVAAVAATPLAERVIADAQGTERLPGAVVRRDGDPPTGDPAADEAWKGFGDTWDLLFHEFGRNSLDGGGMTLAGTVHYGRLYDNAFWDGRRMVFGDGDGEIFGRFTASVEVIGHELGHGVTSHSARLRYSGQPGALNEHVSDVFGIMVKQRVLGQRADASDWLIGEALLLPGVRGVALRNMLHPGTAYDDPRLGRDPQPGHWDDFVVTTDDNGGVHINSGIPNRAFALAAQELGGYTWQGLGRVWFDVLTGGELSPRADFVGFAALTTTAAGQRFGDNSPEHNAVRAGWSAVGLEPGARPLRGRPQSAAVPATADDGDLLLRRSGGVAGTVQQRQTTLAELPTRDAQRWSTLLAGERLATLTGPAMVQDGFCYRVSSLRFAVDVLVPEECLTKALRELFRRTLRP